MLKISANQQVMYDERGDCSTELDIQTIKCHSNLLTTKQFLQCNYYL